MSSVDVKDYITLKISHEKETGGEERKEILQKMFRLWYYYMSPADHKQVEEAMGEQKFEELWK